MTEKEATVFIIDLGRSMGKTNNGRSESDLQWSMRWVWDKLTTVVAASRKTLNVGVIGLRTDATKHLLRDEEGYENISLISRLDPLTMDSLRTIQASIRPSSSATGDAVSAIVIGIEMINDFTKKLKYKRQIYLVTDAEGPIDGDEIDEIAKKINESNIELTILGVDFDDAEYGFKEENKSKVKRKNEQVLKALVAQCGDKAQFATIAEAIEQLDIPRIKTARPYKSYDGALTLGDPSNEKLASISINVERYFKTKIARQMTATTVVVKAGQAGPSQSTDTMEEGDPMDGVESSNFAAVKSARTYKVNDPDAPGGKRDVEFETLAKGFEYGRTAVPFSESDHVVTKLETFKSFDIVGFIPFSKYEPFLNLGESCMTVARKNDVKSQLALSSLIHALSELESYAVARLVMKDDKDPTLVLLAPSIDVDVECLYDVPLPFAEDVRGYQFPPLDRVITVNGTTLTKHRLLPNDDLNEAMSDYVDAMDISEAGLGDAGEAEEYAMIDDSFNPLIHRINQVVKSRAVHPEEPVPAVADILVRYASPPNALVERVKAKTDKLISVSEVKKVPPKAKGRNKREAIKPLSGLDIDALLGDDKTITAISPDNAIPDFKRALNTAEQLSEIEDAAKQMGEIVRQLITDSFADSLYARAKENLGVMRWELIALEEPALYNSFVTDLKKRLLSGALGGDRRDMWLQIKVSRLGLIDNTQSEVSTVSREDAEEFYKSFR